MRNTTILLAVVAMLAVTAQASVLLHEGFDYTTEAINPDNVLAGCPAAAGSGEFGFAANSTWVKTSTYDTTCPRDGASLDSNAFPFTPVGTAVRSSVPGDSYSRADRELSAAATMDLSQDGVFYLSALFRDATTHIQTLKFNDGTTQGMRFGLVKKTTTSLRAFVDVGPSGCASLVDALDFNVTYFFVVKLVTSASEADVISLEVYGPDDIVPLTEPVAWGATDTASVSTVLNYMRVDVGKGSTCGEMDEIRIGETWADVAVPEPATLTLLGLGGLGVLIRRKRK